jgi:hypothetical protein
LKKALAEKYLVIYTCERVNVQPRNLPQDSLELREQCPFRYQNFRGRISMELETRPNSGAFLFTWHLARDVEAASATNLREHADVTARI